MRSTQVLCLILIIIIGAVCFQNSTSSYSDDACHGYGTKWVLFPDGNEQPVVAFLTPSSTSHRGLLPETRDVSDHVNFILYTRSNPNGTEIKLGDKNGLVSSAFDKTKEVKFVTHGYHSSGNSDTCQTIKNQFLEKGDVNVFVINWEQLAAEFYLTAFMYPSKVGEHAAKFLMFLTENGVNPKRVHAVGHSLGAHLSGFIGKNAAKSGTKIARITGLDPALPGFDLLTASQDRLDKSDADFVDVIHTCGGLLGFLDPLGHADFYPNGGVPLQPGCNLMESICEVCSHGRSWKFFAESINAAKPFVAYSCESWVDYETNGNCKGSSVEMGNGASTEAKGKYFLKTSDSSPFALGPDARFDGANDINKN